MMVAREFELLGELEDEFEEEAMEVEPFFARGGALEFGGPARVRRSAPRGAYQADLDDEPEGEALELEPFFSRRGIFEFENPAGRKSLPPGVQALLKQIRNRPRDFKKLVLMAALHPQPI
jgi:hypothetical protein